MEQKKFDQDLKSLMSKESKTISSMVSKAANSYATQQKFVGPNMDDFTTQTEEESEQLRAAYLKIIDTPTWKQQIEDAATLISENLVTDFEQCEVVEKRITVAYNGKLHEFNTDNTKFILIGIKRDCDIKLLTGSRLHAIVMPFPQLGIYLVIDMGGCVGFDTIKRSTGKELINSHPNQRNICIFDWNEISIFNFWHNKIAINPKECLICFENPRSKVFGCGHYATCDVCMHKINTCPICRVPIIHVESKYALATMQTQGK
jgi:Zinc finger, C3HC4 type (RING finger)